MQTEALHLQPRRRDPHALSRALQPLAPLSCALLTRRGKPVPLSSAGYVLRFGRSYQLHVVLPLAEDEIKELKLINLPHFISQEKPLHDVNDEGEVWAIPIKVQPDLLSGLWRLGLDVRCDDLELAAYAAPSSRQEDIQYSCPIVVSHRWLFVTVMAVLGIVSTVLYQVIAALLSHNPQLSRDLLELLLEVVARPASWWAVAGFAVLGIVFSAGVRLATVWWRCRELRAHFREAFPRVEEPA